RHRRRLACRCPGPHPASRRCRRTRQSHHQGSARRPPACALAQRRSTSVIRWLLLALLGAGHALAFAPGPLPAFSLAIMQLASMAVLAGAVWRADSARAAARAGYAFGFGTFAAGLCWLYISMHVYGHMASWLAASAVGLFAAVLSLFPAAAAALAWRYAGRPGAPW